MYSIKKIMMIGAAALTLSAGAAVTAQAAQPLTTPYIDSLNWKVTQAAREGRISWPEARQLRSELWSVHDLAWRNQTGHINAEQHDHLANVVTHVEMRATGQAHYANDYGYGGHWDRDYYGWRR